jgi:DNA-binding Lrp family transcriptional regulator
VLSWSETNEARLLHMVTAIVLLRVRRDLVNDVASQLSAMDGISEVYSVSGQYDLVAMVRVKDNDGLAEVVTQQMLKVDGIESSETMLSFRCYSAHDLEGMFSIGS